MLQRKNLWEDRRIPNKKTSRFCPGTRLPEGLREAVNVVGWTTDKHQITVSRGGNDERDTRIL
jgi:hypothetical protein